MLGRICFALLFTLGLSPIINHADDSVEAILNDIHQHQTTSSRVLEPLPEQATLSHGKVTLPNFSGEAVTDKAGLFLYMCEKDKPNESTCYSDCATQWPPFASTTFQNPQVTAESMKSYAGVPFTRTDGINQCTYNKYPLYWFKGDTSPGETKGHCVDSYGCKWHLVSIEGTPIPCEAAPPPPPPSGGSGYTPSSCDYSCKYSHDSSNNCYSDRCGWSWCDSCKNDCGTYEVCGWTPGWRCWNNHQYRSSCCWNAYDPSCTGDGGGYNPPGGGCGTQEVCGWTPGWHCWDNHQYRPSCCWNAYDPSCTGA